MQHCQAHLADVLFAFCSQKYDITLVSPRNYFLYTPLLPAVATGTVEERSIVEPIRRIMAGKVNSLQELVLAATPEHLDIISNMHIQMADYCIGHTHGFYGMLTW